MPRVCARMLLVSLAGRRCLLRQARIREAYLTPDTLALSALLASSTPQGLVLGGDADGRCVTEQGCYDVLTSLW